MFDSMGYPNGFSDAQASGDLSDPDTSGNAGLVQFSAGPGSNLSPVTVIVGILGILVLLRIMGDSDKTSIQPMHVLLGAYNSIAIGLTAIVSILIAKIAVNSLPFPGAIRDSVNAV